MVELTKTQLQKEIIKAHVEQSNQSTSTRSVQPKTGKIEVAKRGTTGLLRARNIMVFTIHAKQRIKEGRYHPFI